MGDLAELMSAVNTDQPTMSSAAQPFNPLQPLATSVSEPTAAAQNQEPSNSSLMS